MEEQRSTGVWVAFIIALVLAIVFGVLWFLRGGNIDRLNADVNSARSATQRVENDLRTARNDIDTANRRAGDLESQLREESRRAADSLASVERRMRTDLDIANQRLESATADLEQLRSAGASGVAAEVREQLADAETELESVRTASGEQIASLTSQLEQARARIAQLEQQPAGTSAPAAAAGTQSGITVSNLPAASTPGTAAAGAQPDVATLRQQADAELKAVRETAARELAAAEAEWRKQNDELAAKAAQSETALDALRNEYAKQTADWQKRLADKDADTASRLDVLQREAAANRNAAATAEEAMKQTGAKLELLQSAFVKQSETLKQASERFGTETKNLVDRVATLEESLAAYGPGGDKFGISPAGRSVGRIVDRIDDGMIMLIDTGSKDGIKPGMKFDVYRPVGEANRFVGMVKVIRVLDEGAMVVSSYLEVNSLVCPQTGRTVFEPEAKYSPFATDKDGKALPLVCSNKIAMPLEAPAVGDILDNPFFFPNKRLQFLIEDDAADPCLLKSIRILGGAANTGQWTSAPDFVVGTGDNAEDADAGLRVTPEHIYRYVEIPQ